MYSRKDRAKIRKTFAEHWEAKAWRHRQLELAGVERLHAPSHHTLGETASLWVCSGLKTARSHGANTGARSMYFWL